MELLHDIFIPRLIAQSGPLEPFKCQQSWRGSLVIIQLHLVHLFMISCQGSFIWIFLPLNVHNIIHIHNNAIWD